MKIKNTLYTVKYDGDLLSYKCRGVACYIFGILGWAKHFEIPVNTLLHQENKSLGFLHLTRLYINHYSYGQKKLTARKIGHFALLGLSTTKVRQLRDELDQVINYNLRDDINLGLNHINKSDLKSFYAKIRQQQTKHQTAMPEIPIPGMAAMQAHKISQAG